MVVRMVPGWLRGLRKAAGGRRGGCVDYAGAADVAVMLAWAAQGCRTVPGRVRGGRKGDGRRQGTMALMLVNCCHDGCCLYVSTASAGTWTGMPVGTSVNTLLPNVTFVGSGIWQVMEASFLHP